MTYRNLFSLETWYAWLTSPFCILVVGAIVLAVVSLSGLPIGNDESNWSITAQMWADDGRLPYRDVVTNKTPGIFIANYISYELFGSDIKVQRVFALVTVLLTALALYYLVKRIRNKHAAAFAAWLFVLIMPLDLVDGAFAQTETFMNLFRILSFLALLVCPETIFGRKQSPHFWTVLSGIAFGLAVSFKQVALLDSIPLLFIIWRLASGRTLSFLARVGSFAVGAVLGIVGSVLPLLLSGGTFAEYVKGAWAILFTSGIISESPFGRFSGFVKNYFEANLFLVIISTVGFVTLREKLVKGFAYSAPLVVWILTDFVIYNAQGQYFDHHHKVLLLSGSIVFGVVADSILQRIRVASNIPEKEVEQTRQQKYLCATLIVALFVFFVPFQPDYFHAVRNRLKGAQGNESQLLGKELSALTAPGDFIYVWGERVGPLYYYANRRPPTRQYLESLLGREGALQELQADLMRVKPSLIILPEGTVPPEWLAAFVLESYHLLFKSHGFSVFGKEG